MSAEISGRQGTRNNTLEIRVKKENPSGPEKPMKPESNPMVPIQVRVGSAIHRLRLSKRRNDPYHIEASTAKAIKAEAIKAEAHNGEKI